MRLSDDRIDNRFTMKFVNNVTKLEFEMANGCKNDGWSTQKKYGFK